MKLRLMTQIVAALSVICFGFAITASVATGQEIERISPQKVKARLGGPDLLIVDVRRAVDWERSNFMIKGAVREDPGQVNMWISKYPKNKTIVFYCA
jgi:rhodanese-related sulfurtransferase